jgi:hypothetical protein
MGECEAGLGPHFKPQKNFDASRMFTSSDIFSGSRRRKGNVCEARSARDGRVLAKTKGPSVKGQIAKLLEASREKVKPTVPKLIFDERKMNDSWKRGFDDYMREREKAEFGLFRVVRCISLLVKGFIRTSLRYVLNKTI